MEAFGKEVVSEFRLSCVWVFMVLNQWFSIRGILPPKGYLVMSEDIFDDHNRREGVGTTGI